MNKHDGTDEEPLVATLEEAEALWKKGIRACVIFDLNIPGGDSEAQKPIPPDLDCEIPF